MTARALLSTLVLLTFSAFGEVNSPVVPRVAVPPPIDHGKPGVNSVPAKGGAPAVVKKGFACEVGPNSPKLVLIPQTHICPDCLKTQRGLAQQAIKEELVLPIEGMPFGQQIGGGWLDQKKNVAYLAGIEDPALINLAQLHDGIRLLAKANADTDDKKLGELLGKQVIPQLALGHEFTLPAFQAALKDAKAEKSENKIAFFSAFEKFLQTVPQGIAAGKTLPQAAMGPNFKTFLEELGDSEIDPSHMPGYLALIQAKMAANAPKDVRDAIDEETKLVVAKKNDAALFLKVNRRLSVLRNAGMVPNLMTAYCAAAEKGKKEVHFSVGALHVPQLYEALRTQALEGGGNPSFLQVDNAFTRHDMETRLGKLAAEGDTREAVVAYAKAAKGIEIARQLASNDREAAKLKAQNTMNDPKLSEKLKEIETLSKQLAENNVPEK